MKFRVRLTALAATVLSVAGVGVSTQSAEAAPIIGVRLCTTVDNFTFTPALTITPALLTAGKLDASYTATCNTQVEVDLAQPFPYIVTSNRPTYSGITHYNYLGDCALAVLVGGTATVGGGVLIGGIVSVTAGTSGGTFNNVAVKIVTPSPDICSEATASGGGYTVGTLP